MRKIKAKNKLSFFLFIFSFFILIILLLLSINILLNNNHKIPQSLWGENIPEYTEDYKCVQFSRDLEYLMEKKGYDVKFIVAMNKNNKTAHAFILIKDTYYDINGYPFNPYENYYNLRCYESYQEFLISK